MLALLSFSSAHSLFVSSSCGDGLGGKGQIANSWIEWNTQAEGTDSADVKSGLGAKTKH